MRVLVTGANGQLGNEMQVLAKENPQHTYFFTDVQELDICDEQAVQACIAENQIDPHNIAAEPSASMTCKMWISAVPALDLQE